MARSSAWSWPRRRACLTRSSFEAWKKQYRHSGYASPAEQQRRASAPTSGVDRVACAAPLAVYGMDEFADWSPEEFAAQLRDNPGPMPGCARHSRTRPWRPHPLDWVENGAVTPPISQGRCGVRSFATANIEAQWFLAGTQGPAGRTGDGDCSSYTGPYGMGWVSDIHGGIDRAIDYPLANH